MERLLDEAGQRAQEVERGAEAVEETAAVAAEEGEVAVAAEGVGGALGQDAAVQDVRSANNMNDATQPAGAQHFRQPRKQPRLLAVRLPRAGTVQQHAAPLLLGPAVALPQSQSSRASSSSGQSRRSLPPPSFDQLARDIEAA